MTAANESTEAPYAARVRYVGSPGMVMRLAASFEAEGLVVRHPPVIEERGGVQASIVDVVLYVADPAAKGLIAAAAKAIAQPKIDRVIARWRERQPTAPIEIVDTPGE